MFFFKYEKIFNLNEKEEAVSCHVHDQVGNVKVLDNHGAESVQKRLQGWRQGKLWKSL